MIRSFDGLEMVVSISTLTKNSLVSGQRTKGSDPSLLPHLDRKILMIKDASTILTLPKDDKAHIFSQLRDAYDGYMGKAFGNIGPQQWKSRFGLIAGVTPEIDRQHSLEQNLGERFLKVRTKYVNRLEATRRAQANIGKDDQIREALKEVTGKFTCAHTISDGQPLPAIPGYLASKVVSLADFLALGRTAVVRHWKTGQVEYKPEPELGTRLCKQLTKLSQSLALVDDLSSVTLAHYVIVRRVAEDTLPKKTLELLQILYNFKDQEPKSTQKLALAVGYDTDTIRRDLDDLRLLGIVSKEAPHPNEFVWKIKPDIVRLMADIYDISLENQHLK